MTRSSEQFPRKPRSNAFSPEGARTTEFLNSGISPFDSLVYARNRDRALRRAMANGNLADGTFLVKQRDDITYTTEQAQATVDSLPKDTQTVLYAEQIARMKDRLDDKTVPTSEIKDFEADKSYYEDRLLNLWIGNTATETQVIPHTPDAA